VLDIKVDTIDTGEVKKGKKKQFNPTMISRSIFLFFLHWSKYFSSSDIFFF